MKRTVKKGGKSYEYTLICSAGRRNILLQALPDDKIRVYAPKNARLKEVDDIVVSRLDWICDMHKKLAFEKKEHAFKIENGVMIEGTRVRIDLVRSVNKSVSLSGGVLTVCTPGFDEKHVEEEIRKYLCALALDRIRENLDLYAPGIGREYGRVTIREQKTRWGSCSQKKNLNFNWKLIMAPKEALTYVVIHELCHLIHFNHSEKFWNEVGARMPEYDVWRKWLRAHGKDLTL